MTSLGFSFNKPWNDDIKSNDTDEGRQKNRRVNIIINQQ